MKILNLFKIFGEKFIKLQKKNANIEMDFCGETSKITFMLQ